MALSLLLILVTDRFKPVFAKRAFFRFALIASPVTGNIALCKGHTLHYFQTGPSAGARVDH